MSRAVVVLGAGAFGTAIANLLSENCEVVNLWCFESEVAQSINENQENKLYLPGIPLNKKIKATNDFEKIIEPGCLIFEAIPVRYLRIVLRKMKKLATKDQIWITLSKGIEKESQLFPFQIIEDEFDFVIKKAVFGGPNFAKELASKKFSAADVAIGDEQHKAILEPILKTSYFKPYFTNDLIGVQLGGTIKNLLTLLVGIAQGYGCGQNTIAYLVCLGLQQASQFLKFLGGQEKTIYGLSGLGDLFLCTTGTLSRNLKIGRKIGDPSTRSSRVLAERVYGVEGERQGEVFPEGVNSAQPFHELIKKHNLNLPLYTGIYEVVFENRSFEDLLSELMSLDTNFSPKNSLPTPP